MLKFVLAAALLLLPAAAAGQSLGLERDAVARDAFQVRMVRHPSWGDLKSAMLRAGVAYEAPPTGSQINRRPDLEAWTILRADGTCEIHIVDPKKRWNPEFAGHELLHCMYGNFHPDHQ